ncbi:MAG: hypothetical protein JWM80_4540, partial [Cyanobacteria bacterium RYN_339]|nr:hypothetical protein [Cyanobacteria bacterium RYN_339]
MLLTTLAAAVIWSGLAPGQQDRQLAGIADGYQGAGLELAFSDPARSAEFNARHDFILAHARELHRALDHFYADKRHAGVPLSKAVRYCCAVAAKEPDAARWLEDLAAVPRLGARSGRIPQTLASLKDPSFVDGGRPIGGKRYIIYGDLERFYLHEFKVAPDGGLAFAST